MNRSNFMKKTRFFIYFFAISPSHRAVGPHVSSIGNQNGSCVYPGHCHLCENVANKWCQLICTQCIPNNVHAINSLHKTSMYFQKPQVLVLFLPAYVILYFISQS